MVGSVFGGGGLVVVLTGGALYAVREVAVYGGGVIIESMTLPLGSVEAISSTWLSSVAVVADVINAEVVIEESEAMEEKDVESEAAVKEAELSITLVELAVVEETANFVN